MPRVYALQLDTVWHEADVNRSAVSDLLAKQKIEPGSLIVLPEMFDVGYTMDVDVACAQTKRTVKYLELLAGQYGATVVAGHAAHDAGGRPANIASVIAPAPMPLTSYVKCHGFTPADEHKSYAAGEGPVLFDWAGFRVAPLICYDLRFPELFRTAVKRGAEMFVVIANWPVARVDHWVTLAKARAIENQAYIVAVNRCGRDPHYVYPGRSMIIDPHGNVVCEAGDSVEVITAEVNSSVVRRWRRDFPALRDARFL